MPGEFKKIAQVSEISPNLSSAAARLLLNFWWAPLQGIFEEGFEDKVTPVFACLCEFLHAVESMWRQAWNNGLTAQADTVTEQKFILTVASTRPADMNAVYYLAMPAHLQPFVEGTVWEKNVFYNLVKWKPHLLQHPLNSKEKKCKQET